MEIKKKINIENKCFDCGKNIEFDGKMIKNGFMLIYKDGSDKEIKVYKCKDCFKKNPSLTNFRECEVYSRIVGYLRPVKRWNLGKKQEFEERKEFKSINK
jgi:hypothetical protein